MRIPENAISTKQKKRRNNPLQSIPGGFYVALLLLLIWGVGSLLGVWIERVFPPSEIAAASIEDTNVSTKPTSQIEVATEPQTALDDLISFGFESAEPVFQAEQLAAFISELDFARSHIVSACTPVSESGDLLSERGGLFSNLAFARAAKVAASIKAIAPKLNLQVQAESDCQLERLEISETKLKTQKQQLAMRVNLPLDSMRLDEQLFFEQAFNLTLNSGYRLFLINHVEAGNLADGAEKLVERLVDQGFAPSQILLLKAPPADTGAAEISNYLNVYTVPEAPKSK